MPRLALTRLNTPPSVYTENLAAGTGNYDIAAAVKGWTDEARECTMPRATCSIRLADHWHS